MSGDVIRWGIVGCGDVCEIKSGPGFQKAGGSALAAVMRRDAGRAEEFARRHGVARWHGDVDSLINDAEVDAVYVATPPGSHLELTRRVAAAGKPCLVEKPMARNTAECEAMIAAFGDTPLFVAYYRRCLPRFEKVAALLPRLGRLRSVDYRLTKRAMDWADGLPWRLRAEESGGGLFMDVGCHALDLIDHLCGPLLDVAGEARNQGGRYREEDRVEMHWTHGSGLTGAALFDFAAEGEQDEMRIEGEQGMIACSLFEEAPVCLKTDAGVEQLDVPHPPHVHQPLIQAVVNELRGVGRCPATAEAGLRTARVMDAVLESYYGDRRGAFWRTPERWPGSSAALPTA